MFQSFGFSGARSLSGSSWSTCRALAAAAVAAGGTVLSGCSAGADAAARSGAGAGCRVFFVSGTGRGAFAARSASFVQALAASEAPVMACFPGRPCPAGLVPSGASSRCWCGLGSGSWASAAFAVGLGVPVVVFGLSGCALPGWPGGRWVPVSSGLLAGGYRFVSFQLSLF